MANPIGGVAQTSAWIQNTALDLQIELPGWTPDWSSWSTGAEFNVNHVAGDVATPRIGAFNPQPWPIPPGSIQRNSL